MKEGQNICEEDSSFTFLCEFCGQKIRVAKNRCGKKGKCPKCKNVLIIPSLQKSAKPVSQSRPSDTNPVGRDSVLDPGLFDIPEELAARRQRQKKPYSPEDLDTLQSQISTVEPEPIPQRKLPAVLDIFLYPTNRAGLISLVIFIGIPLLIDIFLRFLGLAASLLPPLIVFVVFFGLIGFLVHVLIGAYLYWFLTECVRDSAAGDIRAPETAGITPGLWELICELFLIFGCFVFYFLPAFVYFIYFREPDVIFWCLIAYGVVFYPMGLLAVVMFDSFRALNPLLVIGSIFSVFLQYCPLTLLLLAFVYANIRVQMWVMNSDLLVMIVHWIRIYLLMVAAHLLGRFYWRYQEKLNWEV